MDKFDYKDIWVYIEHDAETISPVSLELCCEARKLCDITGDKLAAVIIEPFTEGMFEQIFDCGVDQIIRVRGSGYKEYNCDAWSNLFTVLCREHWPSAVLVGGTVNGRDFAPRFAARLNTGCTSDAIELAYNSESGDIEFIEPAVGGKIMAVITVPVLRPQVGTIRPGTFRHEPTGRREHIEFIDECIDFNEEKIRTKLLKFEPLAQEDGSIADADVVVCVGNGLSSPDKLSKYAELAALLNGQLACTRPVFDRGMMDFRRIIGQSGAMIKPKLYIGFGVSGAINHVAGFAGAKMSVAVNSDPDAAIFNYCDYGIVGDMDEVCEAMIKLLKAE